MPIFTEQLFDSFLKITAAVKLIPQNDFEKHIEEHSNANSSVGQLL
jgi:hypothetical protein